MKKYVIFVLILLIVIISVYGKIKMNSLQDNITKWQNKTAKYKKKVQETESTISKISQRLDDIKSENKELNKIINDKNEEIRNKTKLNVFLKDSIQKIKTENDTIINEQGDSTEVRNFNISRDWFELSGYFMTSYPYHMNIELIKALISLEVTLTQNRNNVWKTYVYTDNNNVEIEDIKTEVNPYNPETSFWNKFNFGVGGFGTGNTIGLFGNLGYTNYNLLLGFSNEGYLIGGQYQF